MESRPIVRVGLGMLGGLFALAVLASPAFAKDDPDAPPADPDVFENALVEYLDEFSNADLDGDGNADFADMNGDGIPDEVPEGFAGDLDLRPGDGRFGSVVIADVGEDAATIVAEGGDASRLLYDCSGMAISYDADGSMVDWAIGIGSREGGGPNGQLVDL